jgi:thymidylate synthase (FAD)
MPEGVQVWFQEAQQQVWDTSNTLYEHALSLGIAKEQARFLLPLNTSTKLYMVGSIRSWIHYLSIRTEASTQKEHRDIALQIQASLAQQLPILAQACDWNKPFLESLLTNDTTHGRLVADEENT